MNSFLDKLVDELLSKHSNDLSEVCIVFPTRRAGLYFKKRYSTRLTSPAWSPAVFSIGDFVNSLCPYQEGDSLDLVFELFNVYKNYFPTESFDKFYPWGVMLLKDFNEVDSALADGKKLFSSITDLKSIEEQFGLADEDMERIGNFWKTFFQNEPGPIKKVFQENWKKLEGIYTGFISSVQKKNMVYEGLAMRMVAEGLQKGSIISPHRQHVFAGFYSLTKAEEKVIRYFINKGNGEVYADADAYYTDDLRQEAGVFIRKNSLLTPTFKWKEDLLEKEEKKIEMIGVPLQVLQAKTAGQIVHGLMNNGEVMDRTAVVLPDEQLLMPVLYSLPGSVEDINVTMGYPLSASPLFNLTESLFELQKSFKQKSFYFKPVLSLLSHPYIHYSDPQGISRWLEDFRRNPTIRIPLNLLSGSNVPPLLNILFSGYSTLEEALEYFNRFFSFLVDACRQDVFQSIEKEYITYFYTRFKKLSEIIVKAESGISIDTFRTLFREVILSTRIPFTGEPLKGLQVMGFLETRVLDFENVIILSLNENALPPAGHHPSFVPYNIRRAFGLPTFEDNNAISAYHFYRLLQRAKNVFLVYNTEVKNFSGGEKSRFLLQIEHELVKRNPKIKLIHKIADLEVKEVNTSPVVIQKTPEVMKVLEGYYEPLTLPLKYAKKFSASGLISYISCPLQFYFKNIAKLREPEEQDEFIEGGLLGTILHEAMHSLYKPLKQLTEKDFDKIIQLADRAVDEAIKTRFGEVEALEGKNILMRNVLVELIKKIIEHDRKALRSIKYLEQEFTMPVQLSNGKTVHLYGVIDRVDNANGLLQIVDYKTGMPDSRKMQDVESLFSSPAYKEQFQAFFYSLLLDHTEPGAAIKAGLFRLKKLSEGISNINEDKVITREQFDEFFGLTQSNLEEIFNPSIPFRQTKDEERCTYCAYRDICNR